MYYLFYPDDPYGNSYYILKKCTNEQELMNYLKSFKDDALKDVIIINKDACKTVIIERTLTLVDM